MSSRTWFVALALCVALGVGCAKKGPDADEGVGGPDGAGAMGEDRLGGSSLDRAKQGLSPQEDGVLKDVHFGYDSADVDGEARAVIDRNLQWLRENPRAKLELEGHCDARGTIEYNLALGAKRAKSVKDALVEQGVDGSRVSTISYGKELSLCSEDTEECWARNRRVHFVILDQ